MIFDSIYQTSTAHHAPSALLTVTMPTTACLNDLVIDFFTTSFVIALFYSLCNKFVIHMCICTMHLCITNLFSEELCINNMPTCMPKMIMAQASHPQLYNALCGI